VKEGQPARRYRCRVRRPLTPNERAVIERLLSVDFPEGDASSWLMLMQEDGWLNELEHVSGYGPRPNELDASKITPEAWT
jgi:hypothetical protein